MMPEVCFFGFGLS